MTTAGKLRRPVLISGKWMRMIIEKKQNSSPEVFLRLIIPFLVSSFQYNRNGMFSCLGGKNH